MNRLVLCLLLLLPTACAGDDSSASDDAGAGAGDGDDGSDGDGSGNEEEGQPVGCEWIQGENCWRTAVNEISSCASEQDGIFDSTRSTCSTADGELIQFGTAVPQPVDFEYSWDIKIDQAAESCGRFLTLPNNNGFLLTTASGETRIGSSGLGEIITCPDGSRYRLSIEEAFDCLFDLPGISWSEAGAKLLVSISGGDDGHILSCGPPEP